MLPGRFVAKIWLDLRYLTVPSIEHSPKELSLGKTNRLLRDGIISKLCCTCTENVTDTHPVSITLQSTHQCSMEMRHDGLTGCPGWMTPTGQTAH